MTDEDELEYMLAQSMDGLVIGIYIQSSTRLTQDELLKALQYFVDRATASDENLLDIDDSDLSH